MPLYPNVNYMYRNNRDLTFSNENEKWGSGPESYSNGSAYADLDNDGDLDLIVNNINEPAFIYRNNAEKHLNNHFVSIKLKGSRLNQIWNRNQGYTFLQWPETGCRTIFNKGIYVCQFPKFCISDWDHQIIIDSIIVRWPDLAEQRLTDIPADTIITFEL